MNRIKNSLFSFFASHANSQKLYDSVRPVVIYPFYHTITDDYLPFLNKLYQPKTMKAFQEDIEYFMQHFRPVSGSDVYAFHKKEKELTNRSFHLSFDDGMKEIYTSVFPYLYKKGIPATLFVNTAFIDNKEMFYRHKAALIIEKTNSKNLSQTILKEIKKTHFPFSKQDIQTDILAIKYKQKEKLNQIAKLMDLDLEDLAIW